MGRGQHPVGHGPCQLGPLGPRHGLVQTPFGLSEGLDRDEHGPGTQGEVLAGQGLPGMGG
jgi:hypothetical protein